MRILSSARKKGNSQGGDFGLVSSMLCVLALVASEDTRNCFGITICSTVATSQSPECSMFKS